MATAKNIPPGVAQKIDPALLAWFRDEIRSAINDTDSEKANRPTGATSGNIATLDANGDPVDSGSQVTGFAESGHNHALNDLSEKSYSSLDDKPQAAAASDGNAATNASALSASAGADTIDRAALNTSLTTLVTEINAIVTKYNELRTNYNDLIDKLQTAGLMA